MAAFPYANVSAKRILARVLPGVLGRAGIDSDSLVCYCL